MQEKEPIHLGVKNMLGTIMAISFLAKHISATYYKLSGVKEKIEMATKGKDTRQIIRQRLSQKENRKKFCLSSTDFTLKIQSDVMKLVFALAFWSSQNFAVTLTPASFYTSLSTGSCSTNFLWEIWSLLHFHSCPTNLWPPGSADKTMENKYDCMESLAV